jgi:hypothetical protein
MTNSKNSMIIAVLRRSVRYTRYGSIGAAVLFFMMAVAPGGHASAAANEAEARALFVKFVAAQNAHNVSDVKALLWKSPSMLLYARNVETRGPEAVADRFKQYYEGTWHLEPDMSQFRVAVISDDVMQILVPIVFTRGLPGKPSQDNTFLISQTFVYDANGWRVASIMPIANTELK